MKVCVDLSEQELAALELMARGRQIRITAGDLPAAPEDRAIAKLLVAAQNTLRPVQP